MKGLSFAAILLVFASTAFADAPACTPEPDKSEVQRDDEFCKVTHISGDIARIKYESLSVEAVSPKPNTFPQKYLDEAIILAKYTDGAVCWKIQRPLYHMVDGEWVYMRPDSCAHFSCNLIEKK